MVGIIFVLVLAFVTLLVMNAPIAVAIAVSSLLAILANGGDAGYTVAQRMANGVDSFPLLAIPFFIFSGYLMGRGGLARRLIDFAALFVGRLPGGLGYVNTLTCMLFGSISGSAAAAVSSVGGFMIPEMNRKGYNRDFNVAVTATAATTGLLIPPSNAMIVYSVAAGSVSIAAMFMAGILPGILIGLCIMAVSGAISVRHGYGKAAAAEAEQRPHPLVTCWRAIPSLLLIVLIIGGILKGYFTATEAAAVAVAYAFLLSVVFYREIPLRDLPGICLQTGLTTAVVMLLIGASSAMSWIMTMANIPQTVSAALMGLSKNPYVILLTINLMLLAVGMFMDLTPALLIFTPILLPVVRQLGLNDIHFGIIIIANLCIGLCTPPVGTCLFIGCGVGKTTIADVTVKALPFFVAMIFALMLITYIPWLSLAIPSMCGLLK
ncbi:MAG: TRAP transporter large permease [Kiritimatiellae bacterium]|nr:TRAP transporter large permease [Kiritimatiellia bacterium]MDD4024791.1 TRAP transporter large permease [Kiritimatiellia bacterium]MDD4622777.1 TRAP transporter large permease [Kiritimatiellia bacterium]